MVLNTKVSDTIYWIVPGLHAGLICRNPGPGEELDFAFFIDQRNLPGGWHRVHRMSLSLMQRYQTGFLLNLSAEFDSNSEGEAMEKEEREIHCQIHTQVQKRFHFQLRLHLKIGVEIVNAVHIHRALPIRKKVPHELALRMLLFNFFHRIFFTTLLRKIGRLLRKIGCLLRNIGRILRNILWRIIPRLINANSRILRFILKGFLSRKHSMVRRHSVAHVVGIHDQSRQSRNMRRKDWMRRHSVKMRTVRVDMHEKTNDTEVRRMSHTTRWSATTELR